MTVSENPSGSDSESGVCMFVDSLEGGRVDRARFGDLVATSSKNSAARRLARMMLQAGVADGPFVACSPDGREHWRCSSLEKFARFDVSENPRPHVRKWAPNLLWGKDV